MNEKPTQDYLLPVSVTSRGDLSKLLRDIEGLEEFLEADKVRGETAKHHKLNPATQDFIEQNNIDLADNKLLVDLKKHIKAIIQHAPNVHMTFASEIDQKSLEKLVAWLRQETHPYALVTTGLQPTLVGGVYLRTPNHVHDFTIKALLRDKRDILAQELEALK